MSGIEQRAHGRNRGLHRLPDGNLVMPTAVRAISAHENKEPYQKRGVVYLANVRVETFQQVLVMPFRTMEEATKYRDLLAELVNRSHRNQVAA